MPPTAQILDRLMPRPAEEIVRARYARWGIYGPNGAGKTTLLSSVPEDQQWWIISIDRENVKPLRGKKHIRVIPMENWDDLDDILFLARAAIKAGKLNGIGFDTWTRVQAHSFNHVAGSKAVNPFDDKQIETYMSEGPRLFRNRDQWQQWGALTATWMDFFTALPVHLIFLMQEFTSQPKLENDILLTTPMLRPEPLNRAFDSLELIGRLYVSLDAQGEIAETDNHNRDIDPTSQEKRMMLIGAHPRYRTKGDSRTLGYCVEDPDFSKLAVTLA